MFLILNNPDFRADAVKSPNDVFIAAKNLINITQNRFTRSCQHGEHNDHRGSESWRADQLAGLPFRGAMDEDAMRVGEEDIGPEMIKLRQVYSPVLINPVMNEGLAFGAGGNEAEKRQIIYIYSRVRPGFTYFFKAVDGNGGSIRAFYSHS